MADSDDLKIDWFRIIIDLCHTHGYTHASIAAAVRSAKSTVQGWKNGATPGYEDGDRLIALWCQVTGNGRETVPRVPRYSHLA